MKNLNWPWAGVFGGAFFWYGAHDLGLYFSAYNCTHPWFVPFVHFVAFIGSIICGLLSFQAWPDGVIDRTQRRGFSAGIGMASASLFTLVILWQGLATLIYSGCER